MLNVLGEKLLQQAIQNDLIAYCPTMDLIALATVDQQVHVFRINGQKVFGVPNRDSQSQVKQLEWKPNGKLTFLP
jgi:anaphase-promoting complex subunit 4